jgi:hypothetical protein
MTPCEQNGHVSFKDKRKPGSDTTCAVCHEIIEKGKLPTELQSPYQPGVVVCMRDECDDDTLRAYRAAGLTFGEGKLIGPSSYGGDYYDCEFTGQDGKPIILNLSTNLFMVVDCDLTKAILVDAMVKGL